jgi:indolepyruvate ferredoxin oxidoreductase beta subunit
MRYDIILTGVGGQGVLSLSALIADAALAEGLSIKQSELHGMSQRGGSVQADLRLADRAIASPTIPDGDADLILSMEPMEALRSLSRLAASGTVVSSADAVRNMDSYPDVEIVLDAIRRLPRAVLVDADAVAKACRAPRAGNMVLIGAAARFLPVGVASLEQAIRDRFALKGEAIIEANLRALAAGLETADAVAAAGV